MERDPYEVLGVPRTASDAEIRRAFWALAKKYHPDVSRDDPDAGRKFIEARDAAERLLDPKQFALHVKPRAPGPAARAGTATPKPPPRPAQAATPPRESTPGPVRAGRLGILEVLSVVAVFVAGLVGVGWALTHPGQQQAGGIPANGTVIWKAAHYGLDDGWGLNLAGNGARIAIVPGTSTDIEVSGGYLAGNGHIAVLPPGQAPTYQHCKAATQHSSSQSEPLSQIRPGRHGSLCVGGGAGDLAALQVARDNGASLVVNITVWEYV